MTSRIAGSPFAMRLLERGLLPDVVIRAGIRSLLSQRLREESRADVDAQQAQLMQLVARLRGDAVAVDTDAANAQHYELPPAFFAHCLGRHLKYSCCWYDDEHTTLDEAEEQMLRLTVERAELADGERILELGCGWGSLNLYMAARFPRAHITGVCNSHSQRAFILERARERGIGNIEIIVCDANVLEFPATTQFDRVVSVEMFEHLRNYGTLFQRIGRWLAPGGTLFVHIFTHRELAYLFEARDASDWMARYFFTGGIMPSDDLLLYFQQPLAIERHWRVDGRHYQRTAEDWLANMDRNEAAIMPVFREVYGRHAARRWWSYWRVFFMSCAELWGYAQGQEWLVSHYLFRNPPART